MARPSPQEYDGEDWDPARYMAMAALLLAE